jgi:hypothetical protein
MRLPSISVLLSVYHAFFWVKNRCYPLNNNDLMIPPNNEVPLFLVYFIIGLPLAQAATFTVYRSNRRKQMIGGAILAVMAVSLAVSYLTGISQFFIYFIIVSFASAIWQMFYDRVSKFLNSVEPPSQN